MSVWSVQTLSVWCFFATPGPTQPIQVERTSGWMPPWFQANVWFGGARVRQEDAGRQVELRAPFVHGVVDDALRK